MAHPEMNLNEAAAEQSQIEFARSQAVKILEEKGQSWDAFLQQLQFRNF
jgi:hypothetical protein